ncbi:hypothetical protein, partial [Pseudomonas aeruginosa]|uniref:hypothetical protein n=2 Tax=Pseudomonas aeruginosa TaxID=287 RepID=UPI001ABCCA23
PRPGFLGMNEGQLPRGECFLRPTEAPLSFRGGRPGKKASLSRPMVAKLSAAFQTPSIRTFRAILDCSTGVFTHMVTTRSMDDVPACVAIDAAMDRFPVSA